MKCTKMLGWLVMAAALSFTACSSEDDLTQEPTPQQQAQTIHISVGAGFDPATTRSTVDYSNGVRTLQFTTGDRLYVWGSYDNMGEEPSGQQYYPYIIAGYLDLDSDSFDPSDPTNATFTGDLTVYEWTNEVGDDQEWDDDLEDYVEVPYYVETPGYYSPALNSPNISTNDPLADFEDVKATLIHKDAVEDEEYDISEDDRKVYYRHNCATTVEELMTTQLGVSGDYDPSTKSFALTKSANQPILNCTISGLEDGVSYKVDYIYGATAAMSDHSMMLYSSLTATGGTLSFAFFAKPANYFHGIRLTNTADANDTYTVSIGQKAFGSKIYNVSRYWYGGAMHRLVDLSNVNKSTHPDGLTLQDGDAVTGLLDGKSKSSQRLKISIADGASVILKGVDIQGYNDNNFEWAGLTCAGDATIILADGSTNTVNGFYRDYPGIFIAEDKTLTIQGSGSLTATGGGAANSYGAGIGGAQNIACGKIVIEGGTVTATGGAGAGIGSGRYSSCGAISISGTANVTATSAHGAGIGGGYGDSTEPSTCGDISISGTANVTATGAGGGAGIGGGNRGSVGAISISGTANVTAKAGMNGAGIGSGYYGTVSGTISIEGGTVTAMGGGNNGQGAGIGTGYHGSCGAISISSGITQVVASMKGNSAHIGAGTSGSSGTVTIDGVADATTSSTFPHLTSVLTNSDKTWTLTPTNPNP